MYFKFAWRYFKAKKSANAINIIAWVTTGVIAFATCCQVLVLSVFNGFEGLVKSLYSTFYSDVKVSPQKGKTFFLAADKIQSIKALSFIDDYSFIVEDKALLQNDETKTPVIIKGVDSNYKRISGVPQKLTAGVFDMGSVDKPGLVAGYGVQNASHIVVDSVFAASEVTIILPKKYINSNDPLESISEGNATARGIFAIQQEFDNNYVITNIDFVKQQMNLKPNEYSALEIKLKPGANEKEAKEKLQQLLGKPYLVQTRYEQNTGLYNTMRLEKWAIFAVLTLILVIAAFNMISAVTMLVLEKKKDISILRSLGSTGGFIQKIFLSEGLLLGLIGAGIGIFLATAICLLQIKFHFIKLQGGSFLIDYFPVKLIASDFLLVSCTALFIALAAAWYPSLKASRQPIELK